MSRKNLKNRPDKTQSSKTLIEPLEQRLLYSADHPLGLAVAVADESESHWQNDLQEDRLTAIHLAASVQAVIDGPSRVDSAEQTPVTTVAFVDASVSDFEQLSSLLESQGLVVHAIDTHAEGIEQVGDYLKNYSDLDSVMIFSHGTNSGLTLGNNSLSIDTLTEREEQQLAEWSASMSEDADLLLFGCNLAAEADGRALLSRLSVITQADVAASDDTTGHVSKGGDWDLEWRAGEVNTQLIDARLMEDWQGALASITVDAELDIVDAQDTSTLAALLADKGADNRISLREAILVANNDSSVDLVTLSANTTYQLTHAGYGELTISGNYSITGQGADSTIIEQTLLGERVINVDSGANIVGGGAVLSNLTVTGGNTSDDGAGLFVASGVKMTVSSVIITGNQTAKDGGGISGAGIVDAYDTSIRDNTAGRSGGGIYSSGLLTLNRVTLSANEADSFGGGIFTKNGNYTQITFTTISGNIADKGAGIDVSSRMDVFRSTIVENTANNEGGGLRINGGGVVEMSSTVLANNTSVFGGNANQDVTGNFTSLGFNFIEERGSNWLKATDLQGSDPGLEALALGSGKVETHALATGSALTNSGSAASSSGLLAANGRELDVLPDIGAFESGTLAGTLFWTDGVDKIFRSAADGSHIQIIMQGLSKPVDIEVDHDTGKIYWIEYVEDADDEDDSYYELNTASLDGSNKESKTGIFTFGPVIRGFAVNTSAGEWYMTLDSNNDKDYIIRYTEGVADPEYIAKAANPRDIEMDVDGDRIVWTESERAVSFLPPVYASSSSLNSKALNAITGNVSENGTPEGDIVDIVNSTTGLALVNTNGEARQYWVSPSTEVIGYHISGSGTTDTATYPGRNFTGVVHDSINDRIIVTTGSGGSLWSLSTDLTSRMELQNSLGSINSIAYLASVDLSPSQVNSTALVVDEGGGGVIDTAKLNHTDSNNAASELVYSISAGPDEGELQIGGVKVTTFTQQDIDDGDVRYVNSGEHEGNDVQWQDRFIYSLTDGTSILSNQQFDIIINNVDDPPEISVNTSVELDEGAIITITADKLTVTDEEGSASDILYTVTTEPVEGEIRKEGTRTSTFTQQDIDDNKITYVNNGEHVGNVNQWQDEFTFSVSDGTSAIDSQQFEFTINNVEDPPVILINAGSEILEGDTHTITDAELSVTDDDNPPNEIVYEVRALPGEGTLYRLGVELGLGSKFTQEDLNDGRVSYVNDGNHTGFDAVWSDEFTFSVSDGTTTITGEKFVLTVNNVDDEPVLGINAGLDLEEGKEKTITSAELKFTDVDTRPIDIVYTVSGAPSEGVVLLSGTTVLSAGASFTQKDLDDGLISYKNDGNHTGFDTVWSDEFTFSVSDGTTTITGEKFVLTVNNVDDEPVLGINAGLDLEEGKEKTITSAELKFTDVDTRPIDIVYTVSGAPSEGVVLLSGTTVLSAGASFTQKDLDDGLVSYKNDGTHEGFDATWSDEFTFSVSDGTTTITGEKFVLTVNNVDDEPVLGINAGLDLEEGKEKTITSAELKFTDVDTRPIDIVYTVSDAPSEGVVLLSGTTVLSAGASFTQKDLDDGLISYKNDGTHEGFDATWSDEFTFSVSDGTTTITGEKFVLTVNNVDDEPVLGINAGLDLEEGKEKTITSAELKFTDVDTRPIDIVYTVSGAPSEGVVLVSGTTVLGAGASFTQKDLDDGLISYKNDGTHEGFDATWTDRFTFSVTDGTTTITDQQFELSLSNVRDAPIVSVNEGLELDEGELKPITFADLEVIDADTPTSAIVYTVVQAPGEGSVLLSGTIISAGSTFTQKDLDDGLIFYKNNGTHAGLDDTWTDSFTFSVSDETDTLAQTTQFVLTLNNVDDAPTLTLVQGVLVQEGGSLTLTEAMVEVSDEDTASDDLQFTVTDIQAGQLLVDGSGRSSFSYSDILDGKVRYQHNGAERSVESSISFSLTDGTSALTVQKLVFNVDPIDDETPVVQDQSLSGARGEAFVELDSGALSLLSGVTDADEPQGNVEFNLAVAARHGSIVIHPDGTFSYQHDGSESFTDSFTYTVTDSGGNTSLPATVSIVITGNSTPVVNGVVDTQVATETQEFSVRLGDELFKDRDVDDVLEYVLSRADGSEIPSWLTFDNASRVLSGTPGDADTGQLDLMVKAVDPQGASSEGIVFRLSVVDLNQAPDLIVESQAEVLENLSGERVAAIAFTDADQADDVTLSVNDSRFEVVGMELKLKAGESLDFESEPLVQLQITAQDSGGASITRNVTISVQDGNDVPVASGTATTLNLERGQSTSLPAGNWFIDQDGDTLSYELRLASGESLPDWLGFDAQDLRVSLGEVPANASSVSVILVANDGRGGTAQQVLELNIAEIVEPPTVPEPEPEPEIEPAVPEVEPSRPVIETDSLFDGLPSAQVASSPNNSLQAGSSNNSSAEVQGSGNQVVAPEAAGTGIVVEVDSLSAKDLSEKLLALSGDTVISDQIGDAFKAKRLEISRADLGNVFNGSINLSDLFAAAERQDVQTFSQLAKQFERQREEMDARETLSSALVGSSITLTSSLSIGYLIYLVRGGAIVSSMLSSLPAWRFVDPLPILGSMGDGLDSDNESLSSIVTTADSAQSSRAA